jgi:hypothetical protein
MLDSALQRFSGTGKEMAYLFPVSVAQQQHRRAAGQKKSARQTAMMNPTTDVRLFYYFRQAFPD